MYMKYILALFYISSLHAMGTKKQTPLQQKTTPAGDRVIQPPSKLYTKDKPEIKTLTMKQYRAWRRYYEALEKAKKETNPCLL